MNELDDQARELLSQARRALSPTPDDKVRLLQRTLHAAGAPAVAPVGTSLVGKLVIALSIAGLSGTIGYVLGRQASREESAREAHVVVATPSTPMAAEPPPLKPAVASAVAAEPVRKPAARPRSAPKPEPAEVSFDPSAELKSSESALEIEVRFMKSVERALRDNDAGLALRLLDELDAEVPRGILDEERLAASVMARCKLGLGNRVKLVEELTTRYPTSAYGQRVQTSCIKRP
jgi:hypothetical protein